jgi:hypothetical protein
MQMLSCERGVPGYGFKSKPDLTCCYTSNQKYWKINPILKKRKRERKADCGGPDIEGEEEKQWSCGRLLGVPRSIWYFVDVWLFYIKCKYWIPLCPRLR